MGIFDKRVAFKPYEYPDVVKFRRAIAQTAWSADEWEFISDIQDFKTHLTPKQKNVIKNALLAISQIEVSVKEFWAKIGERFPKAEFKAVGYAFANSETIHAEAYSKLLDVLDFNDDFDEVLKNPVILGRVNYLTEFLSRPSSDFEYLFTLTLFSIFIENVSLFSQFLVVKSFSKHLKLFKEIDNVIQATQQEETLHALFGVYLIQLIKREHPEWFDSNFYDMIYRACSKAYAAEVAIIDWIFEKGDLDHIDAETVKEFTKDRFNQSLVMIGGKEMFLVDKETLDKLSWFEEELNLEVNLDFFNKKSTNYAKHTKSFTSEDLF